MTALDGEPVGKTVIRFADAYRIESDDHGWTLETAYRGKTAEGEDVVRWRSSYFGTLSQALRAIVENGPGLGGDYDAEAFLDALTEFGKTVDYLTGPRMRGQ